LVLAYFPQRMKRSLTVNSDYPPQGLVSDGAVGALEMEFEFDWIDIAFQQRIPLTINAGQVPSPQTDFPLSVNDTYPDLIGEVEAEMRFAGSDNIELKYEIAKFDNATGELIAWVNKPTVSDGDFLGIYFDNPSAVDAQNPPAVWDVNYKSVYHEDSAPPTVDSTINAQDMTDGVTVFTEPAQIHNGMRYVGQVASFSQRFPYTGAPTTEVTTEVWLKVPARSDVGIFSYAAGIEDNEWLLFGHGTTTIVVVKGQSLEFDSPTMTDDVFHHYVITWRSSDGLCTQYIDGELINTGNVAVGLSLLDNGSLVLAQDQDTVGGGFTGAQALIGILDEVRWSNIVRSADYVKTSFNNQSSPSTFYTTGAVESVPTGLGDMEFETLGDMEFES